jgi:hypothetical protein
MRTMKTLYSEVNEWGKSTVFPDETIQNWKFPTETKISTNLTVASVSANFNLPGMLQGCNKFNVLFKILSSVTGSYVLVSL